MLSSFVKKELSLTVKIGRIIYDCSKLLNMSISVTCSLNLITISSSHIGKVKSIFKFFKSVGMFYISFLRTQHDIVLTDNLETLFFNCDHENKCRKT